MTGRNSRRSPLPGAARPRNAHQSVVSLRAGGRRLTRVCSTIAGQEARRAIEADQPPGGWCSLDMASVLSGWYGYNLFNVANFIEFAEPFPKRRKLDKANNYNRSAEQVTEVVTSHRESAKRVKSQCSVTYRPYISDLSAPTQKKASCKRTSKSSENSLALRSRAKSEELKERDGTTIDNLFPEILCLIFEKLDLQSKGRAAQVKRSFLKSFPPMVQRFTKVKKRLGGKQWSGL